MKTKDSKHKLKQKQIFQSNNKTKNIQQDIDELKLRLKVIQKQVCSLDSDVKLLLQQKKLKENVHTILLEERKNLEGTFLFKNAHKSKQNEVSQIQTNQNKKRENQNTNKVQNSFKDVNQPILHFIEEIENLKNEKNVQVNQKDSNNNECCQQNKKKLCQSRHLKQIFNPEDQQIHQVKKKKLKEKLSLLYDQVKLNLERQEPYLREKILQKIKRQAQKQTRQKISLQIQRLIKENSNWISQQTNKISNEMQEKQIEEICVSNLGLMKKIMSKKVNNNDFVFENYSKDGINYESEGISSFPVSEVGMRLKKINKILEQQKLKKHLAIIGDSEKSLKQQRYNQDLLQQKFKNSSLTKLLQKQGFQTNQFRQKEQQLLEQLKGVNIIIEKLVK